MPLPARACDKLGLFRLSFLDLIPAAMAILWLADRQPSYWHGAHLGYGAEASPPDATRFLLLVWAMQAELTAAEQAHGALRGGELRALLTLRSV
jgi:hypothetical protein